MKLWGGLAAAIVALFISACSSTNSADHPPNANSGSPTVAPSGTEGSPPAAGDAREACVDLTNKGALRSAMGFVVVAAAVQPGDVSETVSDLETIRDEAPIEFHAALQNIITALQAIDAGAEAGDGRTVDTSAVGPDSRLLAGLCRARGLPIPNVD